MRQGKAMGNIKKIHFVGVGGVGMGTFAVALAEYGYEVSGSDLALYEPMKSVLASARVSLFEGFRSETLTRVKPDVVIVGNVIRRDNAEAKAWIASGIPFLSFPEAVRRYVIGEKTSVVCSGTHGKTTTTSWIAFLMAELGLQPSYLIGGVPRDLSRGCVLSDGKVFVGEGDEYDSAFFDKGPKFFHYKPDTLVISTIEFDHADIYRDLDHVKASFEKLVALLPGDGVCIANSDDPVVREVISHSLCPVETFGAGDGAMWKADHVTESEKGFQFDVTHKGRKVGQFLTPLLGRHNLMNLLSGIICAANFGLPLDRVCAAMEKFHGCRRRQEKLLDAPIVLIDDFAHHPTEVRATLQAVRSRYKGKGTLWAFFEPRSATSRRSVHQEAYGRAFEPADRVLIAEPYKTHQIGETERFSSEMLADELTHQGKWAKVFASSDEMVQELKTAYHPGDIVVVMSNGEFDRIQDKIINALK